MGGGLAGLTTQAVRPKTAKRLSVISPHAIISMNSAQRETLADVFERPTRADVSWSSVEGLVRALGGEVTEGRGSRVRYRLGDRVATFHGPHPKRVTGKATLEDVRRFLENAGVRP